MKKIPFLILLAFCLSSLIGGIFCASNLKTFATDSGTRQVITDSHTDQAGKLGFYQYVTRYSQQNQNDYILLDTDVDMNYSLNGETQNHNLKNTIGTLAHPFTGVFDGQGHVISNLVIDLTESDDQIVYAGLFGYAKGAVIKNVAFQNLTIRLGNASTVYAGAVVGKAESSTLRNIQISNTSISLRGSLSGDVETNYNFSNNTNFGGIAGALEDCDISNIIARTTNFGEQWQLNTKDEVIHNFGGVAGWISNSSMSFMIVEENFNIFVGERFKGQVNLGGVVGELSQGGTKIVNVALSNSYSISNTYEKDGILIGEVAGKISNPAPAPRNISYIHYKQNNINKFGDKGDYIYLDSNSEDFISVSPYSLSTLTEIDDVYPYFENQAWHPLEGKWNFDTDWYIASEKIFLQNFYTDFSVRVTNLNSNLSFVSINSASSMLNNDLRYGDKVEIEFKFNSITDGSDTYGVTSEFFELNTLRRNGEDVARFSTNGTEITVSGSDLYEIETKVANDKITGFIIKIKALTRETSGNYTVTVSNKIFNAEITSRFYNDNGWDSSVVPGYVFNAENIGFETPTTEKISIPNLNFNSVYRFRSVAKINTIYAQENNGWYVIQKDENGDDFEVKVDEKYVHNGVLEFTYGYGIFKGDLRIFAKYIDDSCRIDFIFLEGEGVASVVLSNSVTITPNADTVSVSIPKDLENLSIRILVYKNYEFDAQRLIEESVYNAVGGTPLFDENYVMDTSDAQYDSYLFTVKMANINSNSVDNFTATMRTTLRNKVDYSWIWWVVGGVAGGLVLIGIIILIVWLVRRNRFGGGFGGGKISKKSYKNVYY